MQSYVSLAVIGMMVLNYFSGQLRQKDFSGTAELEAIGDVIFI